MGLKLDTSREQRNVSLNRERQQILERNPGHIFFGSIVPFLEGNLLLRVK